MKILIVNTFDRGGAANSCIRLHQGLLKEGIDSNLLVLNKTREIESCFQFKAAKKNSNPFFNFLKKVKRKLGKIYSLKFSKLPLSKEVLLLEREQQGFEFYGFPDSPYDITTSKLYQEADIINLHWVAGFLDFESFFKKNKKPVIWTLHDMNPFTGGEHYVQNQFGISEEGLPLKRSFSQLENYYSGVNLNLKINSLLNFTQLSIVSPSKWLQQKAQESTLFKNRNTHLIPYGIDVQKFKDRDVNFSRELFDIPLDKKVILFVADIITNQRKGYAYLKRALEQLDRRDVVLCSIGKGIPILDAQIETIHLGQINDERIISIIYSLADVFVIPSLMDNLPNTVLESLLCGTPVIGFPVGGIPDMIEHAQNGLLTNEVSVDSLKETILLFLNNGILNSREEIRGKAVLKYDQSVQAKEYIKLFKNILDN
jgi:glycosyltransferase involved in cell wall biosynthesis